MRVLVLGGRGFIGRHVVRALAIRGHAVVVGSRHAAARGGAADVRRVRFETLAAPDAWVALLAGIDTVVNCVGILRERPGETYDAIHRAAPAALARACVACGVPRLVHVSALGLQDARHPFLTSKRRGEEALRGLALDVTVVRPSLLDGPDGFGARWLRRAARWPLHFVPEDALGRIAPLDVDDLAIAIARLCEASSNSGFRVVELGGPRTRTIDAHLQALPAGRGAGRARTIRVPMPIARFGARLCDLLHFSPYSMGHLELLGRDNVPVGDDLAWWLGRAPQPVGCDMRGDNPCLAGPVASGVPKHHRSSPAAERARHLQ